MSIDVHEAGLAGEGELSGPYPDLAHDMRLRTIGELAAGLTHELAQPISAVASYVQGSIRRIRDLPIDSSQKTDLIRAMEEALKQAERAGKIISSVRILARKRELIISEVEASALVTSALQLLEIESRQHAIRIHVQDECPNLRVRIDPIQIEQVIINLVRNAIDASRELPLTDRQIFLRALRPFDTEFRFTISDQGEGISASSADRLFQPFFSTRPEGMGVGLSISRSIIEAHGGQIWGKNNMDGGAIFGFSLPIHSGAGNA